MASDRHIHHTKWKNHAEPLHGDSAANQCVGCVSSWWLTDIQNLEGRLTSLLSFREVVMGDSPESEF